MGDARLYAAQFLTNNHALNPSLSTRRLKSGQATILSDAHDESFQRGLCWWHSQACKSTYLQTFVTPKVELPGLLAGHVSQVKMSDVPGWNEPVELH